MSPRWLTLVIVAAALGVFTAACGGGDGDGDPATGEGAIDGPVGPPTTLGALPYDLVRVVELDRPVTLTAAADGQRLYVGEQQGRVFLVDPATGDAELVWDQTDVTGDPAEYVEAGLLGLALDPGGRHLYVSDAIPDPQPDADRAVDRRLTAYELDDAGFVVAESAQVIVSLVKLRPVHNGGEVAFGPDGALHMSIGDGWPFADGLAAGQDPTSILGTIMRITPDPVGGSYTVPDDNPFVDGGGAPEVWVYGLRNPWRFTWDDATGDLWIVDVGQDEREEINRVEPDETPGANFGWSVLEGTLEFSDERQPPEAREVDDAIRAAFVDPVYEYGHDQGCAVVGGVVVRGERYPDLDGAFLFGDFCRPVVQALVPTDGDGADDGHRWEPVAVAEAAATVYSVEEGPDATVYVLSLDGLYRLE